MSEEEVVDDKERERGWRREWEEYKWSISEGVDIIMRTLIALLLLAIAVAFAQRGFNGNLNGDGFNGGGSMNRQGFNMNGGGPMGNSGNFGFNRGKRASAGMNMNVGGANAGGTMRGKRAAMNMNMGAGGMNAGANMRGPRAAPVHVAASKKP